MFEFWTDECFSDHNERNRSIQIDKNFITQTSTFRMYNFIISRTNGTYSRYSVIVGEFPFQGLTAERTNRPSLKGEVRRKMNYTYVLGFVVLRDGVKVFPVSSSSFARTTPGRNRAWSHSGAWRGLKTKWDLKLSLSSPTYLIQYLFF